MTTTMNTDQHVRRVEVRQIIARKNELERIVPIYQQALDHIADASRSGEWGKVASRALREAVSWGHDQEIE